MVSRPFYAQNPSENLNLKEPAYAPDEDPKQHITRVLSVYEARFERVGGAGEGTAALEK
jgi:hypothetical protein